MAARFLASARARTGRGPAGFAPEVTRALPDWPGNVRELETCGERALAVASGEVVPPDLPAEVLATPGMAPSGALSALRYRDVLKIIQERGVREYLSALMGATGGNVSRAAEKAGLARESMHQARNSIPEESR